MFEEHRGYMPDIEDKSADVEPQIVVYIAVNRLNFKRYIGMTTVGLRRRIKNHKASAKAAKVAAYFYKALKKYGIENFEFSILEVCKTRDECLRRERQLISELKPEYNTAAGGLSGPQGWKHSDESRQRMSIAHIGKEGSWRGKKRPPETFIKMNKTRAERGVKYSKVPFSQERIEKIRQKAILRGAPFPNPAPEMLSVWLSNMKSANEKRKKPIICLTDGKSFGHIKAAAKHYGISPQSIARSCTMSAPKCGLLFSWGNKQ